jgi:membrane protein implicated in regulation of membrane protease activity
MTLTVLGWMYLFCFLLGLGYTLISLVLSHGHGLEAGADVDVADGGLDHHHHMPWGKDHPGDSGHTVDSGHPDFPLFSPLTIALGMTMFGGVGTLMNLLRVPGYVTFPSAGVAGVAGWLGAFYFFFKLFRVTQGSSEALMQQVIGKEAQVTLAIPPQGLGEIAYVARGSRYNVPARSEDGQTLPAGTLVTVVTMDDTVCVVKPSVEQRLKNL